MSDTSTPDPRPIPVAGDLVLTGPRFADVDALASAFGELEAIVRDLAATPVHESDDSGVVQRCVLCDAWTEVGHVAHKTGCVFAHAERWVSAHPVSGDQQ